jgi:hypothetical protein
MSSHELARKLLDLPDYPAVVYDFDEEHMERTALREVTLVEPHRMDHERADKTVTTNDPLVICIQ